MITQIGRTLFFMGMAGFIFSGCSSSSSSSSSTDSTGQEISDTLEASLNTVSGTSDDVTGGSYVAMNENHEVAPSSKASYFYEIFLPKALAAACSRTFTGSSGVCTRTVSCQVGAYSFSGTVDLTYSGGSATCTSLSSATSWTRKADFTRTAPRGSVQTISTTGHTNYLGTSVSGGTTMDYSGGNYSLTINGVSKVFSNSSGTSIADISVTSSSPIVMSSLARSSRTVSSGVVNVYHNLAKFTATHTFSNLAWDSSCCYPVSGTVSSTYSGLSTATSSTTTFNSCGSATVVTNTGSSSVITMQNCE